MPIAGNFVPLDRTYFKRRKLYDKTKKKDDKTWAKYYTTELSKNPVVAICVHENVWFAVAQGTRVSLFKLNHEKTKGDEAISLIKNYSKFKNDLTCCAKRHDGKLLVGGDSGGAIHVFDPITARQIRHFNCKDGSICSATFLRNSNYLATASLSNIYIWDIETNCLKVKVNDAHADSIRRVKSHPEQDLTIISGAYDGQIKMWRLPDEQDKLLDNVLTLDTAANIEDLSFFGDNLVCTVGSSCCSLWNILKSNLVHTFENHSKTITSVDITEGGDMLVTGSLDRSVKVLDTFKYEIVKTLPFCDSVNCVSIYKAEEEATYVYVGLENGSLVIYRYSACRTVVAAPALLLSSSSLSISKVDSLLTGFNYRKSLEVAMKQGPGVAFSLIDILIDRGVLEQTLRNVGASSMFRMLSLVYKSIGEKGLSIGIILEFGNCLLDENSWVEVTENKPIIKLLERISNRIETELLELTSLNEVLNFIRFLVGPIRC